MAAKISKYSKRTISKELSAKEKSLLDTPLEQKLYRYAKESKSVLLHGKDNVGRGNLIRSVSHVLRLRLSDWGGFDHFDGIIIPYINDALDDYLPPEMKKAKEDKNHERILELLCDTRFSSNTLSGIDLRLSDGKTIFEKLNERLYFSQDKMIDFLRLAVGKNVLGEKHRNESFFQGTS